MTKRTNYIIIYIVNSCLQEIYVNMVILMIFLWGVLWKPVIRNVIYIEILILQVQNKNNIVNEGVKKWYEKRKLMKSGELSENDYALWQAKFSIKE